MSKAAANAAFYQNARKPEGEDGARLLERMNSGHHAELADWALAQVPPAADARMLDLGCGGGANLLRLLERAPEGAVTGLDYSEVSVELSRKTCAKELASGRCEVVLGDVAELPFENGAFDYVCAFETVYFWPEPTCALAEARRVLAPGGTLLICNEADGTHEQDYRMVGTIEGMTVYRPDELEALIVGAGFAQVRLHRVEERSWIAFEAAG